MRGKSPHSTRSFCAYISEGDPLEVGEPTLESRVDCLLFGSFLSNNALLSIFFVRLDSAGEESVVSSQAEVHNGFVESKA
jgi:hypothetical protein